MTSVRFMGGPLDGQVGVVAGLAPVRELEGSTYRLFKAPGYPAPVAPVSAVYVAEEVFASAG